MHTATAVIYNFNSRLVGLFKQNILRLQITMHHFMVTLEFECLQKLDCKSANQTKTDSLKVVVPDKLIKVDAQ